MISGTSHNKRTYSYASLRQNSTKPNFACPRNVIRNAVPKKDKKDGRENLKNG